MTTLVQKTPRELVLGKRPEAFAHMLDGKIYIREKEQESVPCSKCSRPEIVWKSPERCRVLGTAGNVWDAWKDAAQKLGLL